MQLKGSPQQACCLCWALHLLWHSCLAQTPQVLKLGSGQAALGIPCDGSLAEAGPVEDLRTRQLDPSIHDFCNAWRQIRPLKTAAASTARLSAWIPASCPPPPRGIVPLHVCRGSLTIRTRRLVPGM